jgi:hypothetical protein
MSADYTKKPFKTAFLAENSAKKRLFSRFFAANRQKSIICFLI